MFLVISFSLCMSVYPFLFISLSGYGPEAARSGVRCGRPRAIREIDVAVTSVSTVCLQNAEQQKTELGVLGREKGERGEGEGSRGE